MRFTFQSEQWVPYPVELVFAFFANPQNLPLLMPAWQKPRIEEAQYVTPPPRPVASDPSRRFRSFAAGEGSQFTISFRPFPLSPIRLPWDAYIAEFVWNSHFCDEQRRGPFGYWRHCHHVAEQQHGDVAGTTITDDLAYELPARFLGQRVLSLVNSLVVARQVRGIFKYRQASLEKHLGNLARQFQKAASLEQP